MPVMNMIYFFFILNNDIDYLYNYLYKIENYEISNKYHDITT